LSFLPNRDYLQALARVNNPCGMYRHADRLWVTQKLRQHRNTFRIC